MRKFLRSTWLWKKSIWMNPNSKWCTLKYLTMNLTVILNLIFQTPFFLWIISLITVKNTTLLNLHYQNKTLCKFHKINQIFDLIQNFKVEIFFMLFKIYNKKIYQPLILSCKTIPTREGTINGFTFQSKKCLNFFPINSKIQR